MADADNTTSSAELSDDELARTDFPAWDTTAAMADLTEPTCGEMLRNLAVNLRIAAVLDGKDKASVVGFSRSLIDDDPDHFFDLLKHLGEAAERLKYFTQLVDVAIARLTIGGASYAVQLQQ